MPERLTSPANLHHREGGVLTGPTDCAGSEFPARLPTNRILLMKGEPSLPRSNADEVTHVSSEYTIQRASQAPQYPLPQPCGACRIPPNRRVSDSMEEEEEDAVASVTYLIKQPDTYTISEKQLVTEVKGIYAGLVTVETKCIELENNPTILSTPRLIDAGE